MSPYIEIIMMITSVFIAIVVILLSRIRDLKDIINMSIEDNEKLSEMYISWITKYKCFEKKVNESETIEVRLSEEIRNTFIEDEDKIRFVCNIDCPLNYNCPFSDKTGDCNVPTERCPGPGTFALVRK